MRAALIVLAMSAFVGSAAMATPGLLTAEDVRKICPRAKEAHVAAFADAADSFATAEINTRLRMAHFMAQVMTETGCLRTIEENLNYSFERILQVFSRRRISREDARRLARKPEPFANHVYANIIGNGPPASGDGWAYRGSGFIQLTGRANYRARGELLALPLEAEPDRVREIGTGLDTAIGFWAANGLNAAADAHDHLAVRRLINGRAAHGKEIARANFNLAWRRVFAAKEAAGFESDALLAEAELGGEDDIFEELMSSTGILSDGARESAVDREAALKEYQRSLGLEESGVLDEATRDALLDPSNWRHEWLRDLEEGDTGNVGDDAGSTGGETGSDGQDVTAAPANDPEASVFISFDGSTTLEIGEPVIPDANQGTGTVVRSATMPLLERGRLTQARAAYSTYEVGTREIVPETFVPYTVIDRDDRVAVQPTTGFPARAVVQILFQNDFGEEALCSGALVSRDTVLTAGHCLHSGTIFGRPFSNFRVMPGRNKGATPFGTCGAKAGYTLRGWTEAENDIDARYYDIGALKLDCTVGDSTGWMTLRAVEGEPLGVSTTVQGYAADRAPTGRQWKSVDELRVIEPLKGFYQNDTFGGTSGAPVFLGDAMGEIIGVHTNGLHGEEPWASNNAFTRLTPARVTKIHQWIGAN